MALIRCVRSQRDGFIRIQAVVHAVFVHALHALGLAVFVLLHLEGVEAIVHIAYIVERIPFQLRPVLPLGGRLCDLGRLFAFNVLIYAITQMVERRNVDFPALLPLDAALSHIQRVGHCLAILRNILTHSEHAEVAKADAFLMQIDRAILVGIVIRLKHVACGQHNALHIAIHTAKAHAVRQ